ncbi:MAG: stage II sporulation protein M [Bacillota bacterium]|nr:stage II sporulation protein M [Bacillota bacterium]
MFSNAKDAFVKHVKSNSSIYFFLLLAFIIGVTVGAFTVNGLTAMQREELKNYIQGFLELFDKQDVNSAELFKLSLVENIKQIAIIWLLGVCIIGIPFIFVFVGIRGFLSGFSSGLIIYVLGAKGIIFILSSLLLKEIIILPCIIILGVNGIKFSMSIIKSKSIKRISKESLKSNLISYCLSTGLITMFMIVGIFMEVYISPVLIRVIAPIFAK